MPVRVCLECMQSVSPAKLQKTSRKQNSVLSRNWPDELLGSYSSPKSYAQAFTTLSRRPHSRNVLNKTVDIIGKTSFAKEKELHSCPELMQLMLLLICRLETLDD